jgi:predicted patatin/cPLA2 family phospholipase
MGFQKDWDLNAMRHQIWMMRAEMNSGYNDGFTTWAIKQDLYRLKWLVDETLAQASTYAGETEWLKEQEQEKIIKVLRS